MKRIIILIIASILLTSCGAGSYYAKGSCYPNKHKQGYN